MLKLRTDAMTADAGHIAVKRTMQVMLGAAFVLAAWHMTVRGFGIPKYLVPVPIEVAGAVQKNWRIIASQAGFTLSAAACGLVLSTVLATSLAVSFTMSRKFAQTTLPVVLVFRSTPVAAVAPIMMLIFGRGISTSMAVVTIVSFFPMLVNMMRGLQSADRNAAELLHVYGATRWQQLRMVRIPYALPYLFTGLRVAGSSAILGAMLSEWITGTKGLGNLILESGELRETELLWAAVLTSVIVALTVFWSTSAAEKRLLRWTQR
jgi:ABC-type nitrate/sulfonate/bicarbonate transport system permease component